MIVFTLRLSEAAHVHMLLGVKGRREGAKSGSSVDLHYKVCAAHTDDWGMACWFF